MKLRLKSIVKSCFGRIRLNREVRKFKKDLKIIIGSANTRQEGWISTNYPLLNLTDESSFSEILGKNSVNNFLAEHVWEHLSEDEVVEANLNCFKYLKNGGVLRIAVPDGFHPDPNYIAQVEPRGFGPGADDHKILFDYKTLSTMLANSGFIVKLIEWFDENGEFHSESWDTENGMIKRSSRYDPRNSKNPTAYTSLIIDAIKP
jgi:predicted SAM-dependent methyltransferase